MRIRNFSPITSNVRTTRSKQRPGKNASHHIPEDKYFIDSERIIPIAGLCGDNPSPKKVTALHVVWHEEIAT